MLSKGRWKMMEQPQLVGYQKKLKDSNSRISGGVYSGKLNLSYNSCVPLSVGQVGAVRSGSSCVRKSKAKSPPKASLLGTCS